MASSPPVADIEDLFRDPQFSVNPRLSQKSVLRPTKETKRLNKLYKRNLPINTKPRELVNDFSLAIHSDLTEEEAVQEAARCLKCADAPCQKGCPSNIDIKAFITCIQSRNFYGAAQMILNQNPVGYTCGTLCMTSELCAGCCNLAKTRAGPINISGLQDFAMARYADMKVQARVDPRVQKRDDKKIALVGAGPSSLSCATFLARLGYTNVTILEKYPFGGGLASFEIPEFRLPQQSVLWEVEQVKQLGVKFEYEKSLGTDYTVKSLLEDGYDAVYLGCGKMAPKMIDAFKGLKPEDGYYHSKEFLADAAFASKTLPVETPPPTLKGRVLVLGGGDVATDCARTAFRVGADRVTLCLRRNTACFRATEEEVAMTLEEQADVLPYSLPKAVIRDEETGRIRALELYKTEIDEDGKFVIDEDQFIRVKCDYVISAFGSQAADYLADAISPVPLNKWNEIDVDDYGQCGGDPRVFAGGDIIGADTQVSASNDGKAAAWGIHRLLQNLAPDVPAEMPPYSTEIDDVDISVEVCGVKFPNPYGLASAPPATSCEMIARGFAQGWGFAVTKTFTNDAEIITNVSPRIFSSLQGPAKDRHYQEGFINIELVSEKTAEYWCNGITELKRRFPDRVVVSSIMCCFEKESWQSLARKSCEAGADMIEMNLSCPHGMHEKGMGLALGTFPDKVKEACSWVVEVSTVPVFAKLTPNVTDITVIAQAAVDGGCSGVTAINTVSGLTGFHTDATPGRWSVGKKQQMTYGGLCGNVIRPLAFRGVSAIARAIPGLPIMATGGIDSADVTAQMMYAGASVVQICSAIMNQDFTIIHDLITGLKSILYMKGRKDLKDWRHGMPPLEDQRVEPRPKFGPGEEARRAEKTEKALKVIVKPFLDLELSPDQPKPLMVQDLVGLGLEHVKTYSELNNQEQVVAYVDPEICLNCGKCFSTCNDNGYQAITFDPVTHIPIVDEEKCTGCGLCESVCPALNCIQFKPREGFKAPTRFKKDL
eukprot:m.352751 g.352751  ORF g.352751 m.352751 type:complete len:997 (-) comp16608_c0_seq1:207-3197(-)